MGYCNASRYFYHHRVSLSFLFAHNCHQIQDKCDSIDDTNTIKRPRGILTFLFLSTDIHKFISMNMNMNITIDIGIDKKTSLHDIVTFCQCDWLVCAHASTQWIDRTQNMIGVYVHGTAKHYRLHTFLHLFCDSWWATLYSALLYFSLDKSTGTASF